MLICCHVTSALHFLARALLLHKLPVLLLLAICFPPSRGFTGRGHPSASWNSATSPMVDQRCFDLVPSKLVRLDTSEGDIEFDLDENDEDSEEVEDIEDDEAEDYLPHVASNATKSTSEDYAQQSLLQLYARDREWLSRATEVVLDHNHYPLGQLTLEDVDKIKVLMVSWVRQRSVKAALSVESLLKRVVDDMRANNRQVYVNAKMYSLAMDAWAKSGAEGSAERAQSIHDAMVDVYKENGDLQMRPTTATYNILINAHGKRNDREGMVQAEQVLQEMIESGDNVTMPDVVTFNTLLDAYAKSKNKVRATERAPKLIELMEELKVEQNSYTYTALQSTYSLSDMPNAPQKSMDVLQTMLTLYRDGHLLSKPTCANYNAVLGALSRTHNRTSAEMASRIIERMELPVDQGGYDVQADRMSYALAILTCVRCPSEYGIRKAEQILLRMEARAKEDEEQRRAISSAAPASVVLDLECFNVVMTSLAKRRTPDAVERIIALLGRMKQYADEGNYKILPTARSWNALLNALARSRDKKAGHRAEKILRHMLTREEKKVRPNAFSFTAVLTAYQKSSDPGDAHRADELLREYERLYYEDRQIDSPPDVYHYTIVCNAWARSGLPASRERVMQIIAHMNRLAANGNPDAKPNARTYHALLECIARSGGEGEVECLLDHLMMAEHQGESTLDGFCFSTVIGTLCRSKKRGNGRRAEAVLEKMLEHQQLNPKCKATTRTFTKLIHYYRKSSAPDAPYRAEYILNRMIALFKEGKNELEPDKFAFGVVMDAYSSARHPDSGTTAERLLKQMKDLHTKDGAKNLVVDSSVIYNVLFAWSISGDEDAGLRAELHLDNMERKFEAGNQNMKPDIRSYGLVLNAWSKSNCFDKARRALNVIKRMEVQQQKANTNVRPNEHCLSLVINACAFTNSGPEAEAEAFQIAVSVFDRMLDSDDCRPSSLAYGWFLQACGRLSTSSIKSAEQIERAWTLSCDSGLVNAFVLQRFTGAAPDELYKKLMKPVLQNLDCSFSTKEQLKFKIGPSDLPKDWTVNTKHDSGRAPRVEFWNTK